MESRYKALTVNEIKTLTANGCTSANWKKVKVIDGFDPSACRNVNFSGNIKLGSFDGCFTDESGVSHHYGIYNADLHNCSVGSDVLISNIGEYIANYIIEDNVVLINCGKIHTEGKSSFGNGTSVTVLNEAGGREVTIWDRLSAHEAYIRSLYRHRRRVIRNMELMVKNYSDSMTSSSGIISSNSRIFNTGSIRNVKIGHYCRIENALRLNEGTINSNKAAPVFIGSGVIMDRFIIGSGTQITDSALIENCFVGQGCVTGKHFSARDSLLFANFEGLHGEACSVFAGPYTVTHHKSTLLIAGLFSFMNAGSGSNQSNHMYKIGPVHQGIMERGSKTASGSYLLWPARIGAFTTVIGHHYKNPDTSSFPFSYLIENNKDSILVPGVNLKSAGTFRDSQKWPDRDKRKGDRIDHVNYNIFSPYTVGRMTEGKELLERIKSDADIRASFYPYGNMKIMSGSLEKGIDLYQYGINVFLFNSLIKRIEAVKIKSGKELRKCLSASTEDGTGRWVDMAGLYSPETAVNKLLDGIEKGKIKTVDQLYDSFTEMHNSYSDWEWAWAVERIEKETGKQIEMTIPEDIINLVKKWRKNIADTGRMIYDDARKEFNLSSMTGFGIDGDDKTRKLDFQQVRGTFESNSVAVSILDQLKQNNSRCDELIKKMRMIKS